MVDLSYRNVFFVICFCLLASFAPAAEIELLSGSNLQCKVLSKDDKQVKVEVVVDGKPIERTYQLSAVHAVTINGKRYLINEKGTASKSTTPRVAKPKPAGEPAAAPADAARRSKAEIDALIEQLGREPPEWFEGTPANYPASLDLTYPPKPEGGWNNQKNVSQYVWDVINPNPTKWREGVKLMHDLLIKHQDDPAQRTRVMIELGRMYHDLHEDYARAAFWWRRAGVEKANSTDYRHTTALAGCYWRLGNKKMAVDLLSKQTNTVFSAKLWADMGDLPKAVMVAELFATRNIGGVELAFMYVADGFRQAGQPKEASAWYQRVVDLPATGPQKQRMEKTQARARASLEAMRIFELANLARVADGTYSAESLGYEGPVQVSVTVGAGKIESVRVTQHKEKQFYSAINDTPAKIIAKQGVKGVDATSHATITSEAIINASAKALASGAK